MSILLLTALKYYSASWRGERKGSVKEEVNVRITTDGTPEGTVAVVVDESGDGQGQSIPIQARLTEDKEHMIVGGAIAIPLTQAVRPALKAIKGGCHRAGQAIADPHKTMSALPLFAIIAGIQLAMNWI